MEIKNVRNHVELSHILKCWHSNYIQLYTLQLYTLLTQLVYHRTLSAVYCIQCNIAWKILIITMNIEKSIVRNVFTIWKISVSFWKILSIIIFLVLIIHYINFKTGIHSSFQQNNHIILNKYIFPYYSK